MQQYSIMTAGRPSPISPSVCVSPLDVLPTWPDEDGTKGGKEQASVPPMRPDDDPIGGGSRQAVIRRVRAVETLDALAICAGQMPVVTLLSRALEVMRDLVPAEVHQPIETILYAVEVRA